MHYIQAKSILSPQNGMNLYRGCTHGCIYCDSRSSCYHIDHRFEDVAVKENALELLEDALKRKRKKCMIGTGSMSDPYMPLEEKLLFTRKALELVYRYGFGFTVITKSALVLRDLDLLKKINGSTKAVVQMTLTTFDEGLCRKLEPNVSTTRERFEALKIFRKEGIPTVVWLCPLLPFINDTGENLAGILDYCAQAEVKGIVCFGMGLTLRDGNREYFYRQLDQLFPGMKERYIRTYGNRYELHSSREKELTEQFTAFCREHSILYTPEEVFGYLNAFPEKKAQPELFDYVEN